MIKVLISGSSGFVGINLNRSITFKSFILEDLNLRNANWKYNIFPEATVIIHLAGIAHDTKSSLNSKENFYFNTELTKELFNIF
jgi:nucleoside-diphosphate-sugar epimerase